ncbi:hypothetical protein [Rhodococcus pyridinivorans]|uniref:hypothetical protein n=1 Tax=Rhodococcus pyridinivorans TaxID=103816 RepID=UPI0019058EA3|nr:hypothetical protein [Rhodococcus pyridinivorans]MCW3470431.1 hypothetical protein [Rhodococcus pyridinivorans]QQM53012.1 hypothetical protein JGU70_21670 [Rhodococcus pyridinivorans]
MASRKFDEGQPRHTRRELTPGSVRTRSNLSAARGDADRRAPVAWGAAAGPRLRLAWRK